MICKVIPISLTADISTETLRPEGCGSIHLKWWKREKITTKITLSSKNLFQIQRRNQQFNRQAIVKENIAPQPPKEELKNLLKKVKEENLKLNIQKTKIMASGPIISWEIDGEAIETVTYFIFWVSKITADGDCSHEIKRCLLLGRKAITNLDSILKSRDITLPTKVHLVKVMIFSSSHVWICESWTIKKAKHWRIDAFELWCLRRLLRVPWTARRSNQSILKEISPQYSLEKWYAEVETPILWPPDAKSWLIRKYPDAEKDWRQEERTKHEMVG